MIIGELMAEWLEIRVFGRTAMMVMVMALFGCETGLNTVQNSLKQSKIKDSLAYEDSCVRLFLADTVIDRVYTYQAEEVDLMPWHVPTLEEGRLLHTIDYSIGSSCRCLCVDQDGTWYSFLFGNEGVVSKAGTKTKYCIVPVRSVRVIRDTTIVL